MQAIDTLKELVVKYKFSVEDIGTLQKTIAELVPLQALEAATKELVDASDHCDDPAVEVFIADALETVSDAEVDGCSAVQEMYNQMFNAHLIIQASNPAGKVGAK